MANHLKGSKLRTFLACSVKLLSSTLIKSVYFSLKILCQVEHSYIHRRNAVANLVEINEGLSKISDIQTT